MAFVPTLQAAKAAIEYLWANQKVITTLWFAFTAAEPTDGDLTTLANYLGTTFFDALKAYLTTSIAMTRVTATRQVTAFEQQMSYIPPAPVTGLMAQESVPMNVAAVLTHRTAQRGRSYRGRTYQPGLPDSIRTSPGEFNLASLAAIASVYVTGLITNLPAGWDWAVVSHYTGGQKPNPSLPRIHGLKTNITGVTVDALIDSQRRRLYGRGA